MSWIFHGPPDDIQRRRFAPVAVAAPVVRSSNPAVRGMASWSEDEPFPLVFNARRYAPCGPQHSRAGLPRPHRACAAPRSLRPLGAHDGCQGRGEHLRASPWCAGSRSPPGRADHARRSPCRARKRKKDSKTWLLSRGLIALPSVERSAPLATIVRTPCGRQRAAGPTPREPPRRTRGRRLQRRGRCGRRCTSGTDVCWRGGGRACRGARRGQL